MTEDHNQHIWDLVISPEESPYNPLLVNEHIADQLTPSNGWHDVNSLNRLLGSRYGTVAYASEVKSVMVRKLFECSNRRTAKQGHSGLWNEALVETAAFCGFAKTSDILSFLGLGDPFRKYLDDYLTMKTIRLVVKLFHEGLYVVEGTEEASLEVKIQALLRHLGYMDYATLLAMIIDFGEVVNLVGCNIGYYWTLPRREAQVLHRIRNVYYSEPILAV